VTSQAIGMDGVLRVLAKEIGPYQITVNQVAPGWTITERVWAEGTARQDAYNRLFRSDGGVRIRRLPRSSPFWPPTSPAISPARIILCAEAM
jgi:NAD(P)-dependent dehydrogenase (short-subunit alcohol dehydrogenase family)